MKLALLLVLGIAPSDLQSNPVANQVQVAPFKCDAKPYKFLIGRSLADVMSAKLPPQTRIYRYGDENSQYEKVAKNRLNIEIGDNTFVRRVYCS